MEPILVFGIDFFFKKITKSHEWKRFNRRSTWKFCPNIWRVVYSIINLVRCSECLSRRNILPIIYTFIEQAQSPVNIFLKKTLQPSHVHHFFIEYSRKIVEFILWSCFFFCLFVFFRPFRCWVSNIVTCESAPYQFQLKWYSITCCCQTFRTFKCENHWRVQYWPFISIFRFFFFFFHFYGEFQIGSAVMWRFIVSRLAYSRLMAQLPTMLLNNYVFNLKWFYVNRTMQINGQL